MSDGNIWNGYGRWDEIAKLPNIDEVKKKITGYKRSWRPNFVPPAIAYIFEYAVDEALGSDSHVVPTAVDFGCGLGRNAPILSRFFPRVVGVDLPEMAARIENEFFVQKAYSAIYSAVSDLTSSEDFCALYDSVVFQHLENRDYIHGLIAALSAGLSFRTIISVYNANIPYPHLDILAEKGWTIWHTEIETLSFEGAPHSVTAFRR
jgi:SAM-dependent methyltransferase